MHQIETGRAMRFARPAVVLPALLGLLAVLMLVGGRLDRAPVDPVYRPALVAAPFGGPCDPLPDGVRLDLAVQLRADRMVELPGGGTVRRIELHYDLVDVATAEAAVAAALTDAGFTSTGRDTFERAGYGSLTARATAFDVPDDSIVRGEITLDLPPASLTAAQQASCTDVQQTKRFDSFDGPPDD